MIRVVAGAIVRDGRVLATRRGPGMHLEGLWELPGGKVEPGEGDAVALARELDEELGLEVEVGEYLAENLHDYGSKQVLLVAWSARIVGGTLVLAEHDAHRWLGPDELEAVQWAPADVPLLEAVARHLAG